MATKSSSAKLKRGAPLPRKPRATVKKRKATPKGPTRLDKVLLALRITPAFVRNATTVLTLGAGAVLVLGAANYAGLPRMAGAVLADGVGRAGFVVKNIEITGLDHMDRMTVYGLVLDQHSLSMASVDLAGVRQKLLSYAWVSDAQVTRRLPDTLVINITEHQPAAIWQNNQQLSLVDDRGNVLEQVTAENMPSDIPLIIGPDANTKATAMHDLLAHAPRLKPLIRSASWVGNRRWDLGFQTGEVLALPEGADAAARALTAFAMKDAQHPMLGKGFAHFDTRDGEHILIRVARAGKSDAANPSKSSTDDAPKRETPKAAMKDG